MLQVPITTIDSVCQSNLRMSLEVIKSVSEVITSACTCQDPGFKSLSDKSKESGHTDILRVLMHGQQVSERVSESKEW